MEVAPEEICIYNNSICEVFVFLGKAEYSGGFHVVIITRAQQIRTNLEALG
ncbi:hypothetical protein GCM10010977_29010 [Citricoccus zhacaiensis]|uniref:Uncharacterized protein n=1 Tax=Citricoccus zhacaiensis TaxID=489142 RepID=A0ABQ2M919_9MICC|nr:hypothetical protein GCM10010977_29010 [Citricoccus zhacaiensis]